MFTVRDENISIDAYYTDGPNIYALREEQIITYPNIEHNRNFLNCSILSTVESFEEFLDVDKILQSDIPFLNKAFYLKDYALNIFNLRYLENICFLAHHIEEIDTMVNIIVQKELKLEDKTILIENPFGISNMFDLSPTIINDSTKIIKKGLKM